MLRWYYRHDDGSIAEITDRISQETLELRENAEEGSVAMSTVLIDDPDMDFDISPHKLFFVQEDEIYGAESTFFKGFTADRSYLRGRYPLGRQIRLAVTDYNTLFARRVLISADAKRPAETDVARMQWLVDEAEAGLIDDDTTYLSTDSPVAMDRVDYRGQTLEQVMRDCMEASGKNGFMTYDSVGGLGAQLWYGHQALEVFDSPLYLTNYLADVDDVTTFAISEDTVLERDPSRVFNGIYLPFDGGAIYRFLDYPHDAALRRDGVMPSSNVKTVAKANARADRYLSDLQEEADRITTTVYLPAHQLNDIRPGMRVQFRATHFPGYEGPYHWMRVLSRSVAYWVPGTYKVTLALDGPGTLEPEPPGPSCGIPEVDAFVAQYIYGDNSTYGTWQSHDDGPTFSPTVGQAYRVVVEVDSVLRGRPTAATLLFARVAHYPGGSYKWDPVPPTNWLEVTGQFGPDVYASDWHTWTWDDPATVAWIECGVTGAGGPANIQYHVWVECQ